MPTDNPKTTQASNGINAIGDGNDIELDGIIEGDIDGREITVLEGASIHGEVGAQSIIIHGKIRGTVKALSIKVLSTALVEGKLYYKTLSVDPGARIEAICTPNYQ